VYNYRSFYPGIKILAYLDENTYEEERMAAIILIAGTMSFDGGRCILYPEEVTRFQFFGATIWQHLLGGIQVCDGYRQARTIARPMQLLFGGKTGFVKTILVNDLDTPMELRRCAGWSGVLYRLRSGEPLRI